MNQDSQKCVLRFSCDCLENDLLPTLPARLRLDHGRRRHQWQWQQWQCDRGSDSDDDRSGGNRSAKTVLMETASQRAEQLNTQDAPYIALSSTYVQAHGSCPHNLIVSAVWNLITD